MSAPKTKNLGGGVVASLDKDGAYISIGGRNNAILLNPDQAIALRDWLIQTMKEYRHD